MVTVWHGCACVPVSLILRHTGPKGKNTDAGSSDVSKNSSKVLCLSEKAKVLDLNKIKLHAEVAKTYNKNKSICEIVKEKLMLDLLLHLKPRMLQTSCVRRA